MARIIQFILKFSIPKLVCLASLTILQGLQLPGNIALLVVVCENLYKVSNPTKIHNLCGRKTCLLVLCCSWSFAFIWCVVFWFYELKDYTFKCMLNAKLPSTSFWFTTTNVLTTIFILTLMLQFITVILTFRRYSILRKHFQIRTKGSKIKEASFRQLKEMRDLFTSTAQHNSRENNDLKCLLLNELVKNIENQIHEPLPHVLSASNLTHDRNEYNSIELIDISNCGSNLENNTTGKKHRKSNT